MYDNTDDVLGEVVSIRPEQLKLFPDEDDMERELGVKNILDLYQEFTPNTWIQNDDYNADLNHATSGLFAEAGEVAGAYQKFYRGDYDEEELKSRLEKEIGGLMYYLSMVCNIEGLRLSSIVLKNRDILLDRKNRGVIKGDGDDR